MAVNPPPKYKTALLIWATIYPSLTLVFYLFGDYLMLLPLPLRTLLLTAVLVPFAVYVGLPFLSKLFAAWLHKA